MRLVGIGRVWFLLQMCSLETSNRQGADMRECRSGRVRIDLALCRFMSSGLKVQCIGAFALPTYITSCPLSGQRCQTRTHRTPTGQHQPLRTVQPAAGTGAGPTVGVRCALLPPLLHAVRHGTPEDRVRQCTAPSLIVGISENSGQPADRCPLQLSLQSQFTLRSYYWLAFLIVVH